MKRKIKFVASSIAFFSFFAQIHAITYTLIGGNGPSWEEPLNWQNNLYPGFTINADDIVNINTGFIINFYGTLNNYGTINVNTGIQNYGTMNIHSTGTINNNDVATFNNYGILNNDGTINNYNLSIFNIAWTDATINNYGTINNYLGMDAGGRIFVYGGIFNNYNTGIINNNTGCLLQTSPSTAIFLNNGILNNDGSFGNGSIIKGTGTIYQNNYWVNNPLSSIAPGNSPGKLTVSGEFNLGVSTYNCEIYGTNQGDTYDWLSISGAATLSNAKLVVDWGSFTPTSGIYTIMAHEGFE